MAGSPKQNPDPESHLPLAPRDFQVLLLLLDEPMHGYGIVKASADEHGSSVLDLGSLYRIIGRLTKEGLLEDVTGELADSKRQRRYYRATELGRRVARAEAIRLRSLLESERADLLWEKP
ncbi:MAG: PadR family transcriptional regulator [Gemmatimonadota bacterium]|jgi:DNA-binding PadR family transcriptional regulator